MNTKIEYMYRDADNYKAFGTCVLEGALEDKEQKELWECLEPEGLFLPGTVGIPLLHLSEEPDPEVDHPWHTLLDVGSTDLPPTGDVWPDDAASHADAQELLDAFRKMRGRWQAFEARETERLFGYDHA